MKNKPPLEPRLQDFGMGFEHNMPCCVYHNGQVIGEPRCDTTHIHAVHRDGVFHPSWRAQHEGWQLIRARNRFERWILWFFFDARFPEKNSRFVQEQLERR